MVQTQNQQESGIDRLRSEYAHRATEKAFSSLDNKLGETDKQRISSSPTKIEKGESEKLYEEVARIQTNLGMLAEEHGKLDMRFSDLVGKQKYLNFSDVVKYCGYKMIGQRKKAAEVKVKAISRKGQTIDILSGRIAEVIEEQHQNAIQGIELAYQVQTQNTNHTKTVNKNLVERLKGSYSKDLDLVEAEKEVAKIEANLGSYEGLIAEYEKNIMEAKKNQDVGKIKKLTDDLGQLVEEQGIELDTKQDTERIVHEVRRRILDYTEGVRSAKNAIAALKVSDKQCGALIDSWNKLEIKYRHAKEDMVEIYRIQGKVAAYGIQALEMNKILQQTAESYRQLLDYNARLVTHLGEETFKLIQTDLYDPEKSKEIEMKLKASLDQQQKLEAKWAQNQQLITESLKQAQDFMTSKPLPNGPGYTVQG